MWKLIGTWALKGATWALANHPGLAEEDAGGTEMSGINTLSLRGRIKRLEQENAQLRTYAGQLRDVLDTTFRQKQELTNSVLARLKFLFLKR
jgi:hypothetical protein